MNSSYESTRLAEIRERASRAMPYTAQIEDELISTRSDVRWLLRRIDDLDEQLTDALNPAWDDE